MYRSLILVLAVATAPTALAHGPQIQITNDAGRIVTRRLFQDGSYVTSRTAETRVYVMPLKQFAGAWYTRPNGSLVLGQPEFFSGPGFAYGYDYDPMTPGTTPFPAGDKFYLRLVDGLRRWNGSSFEDAGAAEMEAFTGGNPAIPSGVIRTVDAGASPALSVTTAGGGVINFGVDGREVHSTVRYRLLGDGVSPASASSDGLYLLTLQLSLQSGIFVPSEPFHFLLPKNYTGSAAAAAATLAPAALVQIVPEPGSTAMIAAALGGLLLGPWRRRRKGAQTP